MITNISSILSINTPQFKGKVKNTPNFTEKPDSFEITDKKNLQISKLNSLFTDGGIDAVYKEMNDFFKIDKPAKLNFVGANDGVVGGGFCFSTNEINLSLDDLLVDTKVVGIKNNKKITLVSPKEKFPLFIDKQLAEDFVKLHSQHGNLGFDKLIIEPVTPEEQRKFIEQKISHEVIHAQQHMLLRQTENIGTKEIIKAWTHQKPKNLIEEKLLNELTEKLYKNSYWKDQPETPVLIKRGAPIESKVRTWLEAIRNYPPIESPEYSKNAIEVDAYNRAALYANKKYHEQI